jgi:hypothetical protein
MRLLFIGVVNGDHLYYNPLSFTYELRRSTPTGLFIVGPLSWERCASDLVLSSLLDELEDYYNNPIAVY